MNEYCLGLWQPFCSLSKHDQEAKCELTFISRKLNADLILCTRMQLNAAACMASTHVWQVGCVLQYMSQHCKLTLILATCRIWGTPNNVSKWQMGFNSVFKGLNVLKCPIPYTPVQYQYLVIYDTINSDVSAVWNILWECKLAWIEGTMPFHTFNLRYHGIRRISIKRRVLVVWQPQ